MTAYKYRYLLLLLVLLSVGALSVKLPGLKIDNSFDIWFVENDPALQRYKSFLEEFGNDEVIVTVISSEQSMLTEKDLKELEDLTSCFASIEGVYQVLSLTEYAKISLNAAPNPFADNLLEATDLLTTVTNTVNNSAMASRFINEEQNAFRVYTWLDTLENIDSQRRSIINQVDSICSSAIQAPKEVFHGGVGIIINALNESIISESGIFLPISYLLILIVVFVLSKSWRWVLAALFSILLATLTLFATMALCNRPITMISMALPPLVLIMCVANIMHYSRFIAWHTEKEGDSLNSRWKGFLIVLKPCLFNALTTAGGFLSLASAEMAITRDYGIFAAYSVVMAFIFSAVGTTIVLKNVQKKSFNVSANSALSLMKWACKRNIIVVIIAIGFALVCVYGITKITVDTYSIKFLPEDHKFRVHSDKIENKSGNYLPLEFVCELKEGKKWQDLEFLQLLVKAQEDIKANTRTDAVYSIANIVFENYGLQSDWNEDNDILNSTEMVLQVENIITSLEKLDVTKTLVNAENRTVRFTCMVPMSSARNLADLGDVIKKIAQSHIDDFGEIKKTGYLPLYSILISNLIRDQVTSIVIALICISILIALLLRSYRMLIISLIVNIIPLGGVMAIMGYFNIFLDVATVTIAPSILGIIVDDTLHLLYHLKQNLKEGKEIETSLKNTIGHTGATLMATSIILIIGFGVMGFAQVSSIALAGLLTAAAVGMALITDLMLLPVLASFLLKERKAPKKLSENP